VEHTWRVIVGEGVLAARAHRASFTADEGERPDGGISEPRQLQSTK
jgi:hypothetical protein